MSTSSLDSMQIVLEPSAGGVSLPLGGAAALVRSQTAREIGVVAGPLQMLRAVVLLGGAVRQSEFRRSIGRSILDLPLDATRTLLDGWCQQVHALARAVRWERPHIRLMIDRQAPAPRVPHVFTGDGVDVLTQPDPSEFRGTGGILRDLSDEFADDEYLLVANAAQILREPLIRSAAALASSAADVSLVAHDDGRPSGLALVRCGALRQVRGTGYIDFKEQALGQIAVDHSVKVSRLPSSSAMPVRTLRDYIDALRALHSDAKGAAALSNSGPLAETGSAVFAIVEPGADVHPAAELYDSVVLQGARVERGAVVVRSIVCRDAVVPAGVTSLNRVIGNGAASAFSSAPPRQSWPFHAQESSEFFA